VFSKLQMLIQFLLSMDSNKVFNTVYTLCPYTAEWANFIEEGDRFKYIYTPFNKDHCCRTKGRKAVYDALILGWNAWPRP
jgi:hypothetical protein